MAKKKDDEGGNDADAPAEDAGADPQEKIWRLFRGQRRMSWVLLILLFAVIGASAYQIMELQGRLGDVESNVGQRAGRAFDDFARIQDQTAAIRGGVELLHKEVVKMRAQVDEIARRQAEMRE